eukprot:scaffold345_cov134-Cylindrotheca_fusiformis.AAC.36
MQLLTSHLASFRLASKSNGNVDEPGAFPAREWLRQLVVGKMVQFETRKQGASAGDRVYGLLMFTEPGSSQPINIAVEAVRNGNATPKIIGSSDDSNGEDGDDYKKNLIAAFEEAKKSKANIHSGSPLVRKLQNAGDDFEVSSLVQKSQKLGDHGKIKCVIDYVFDGSRFRLHVTDPTMGDMQHASFTLFLAGVASPRLGNPRADPPTPPEEFATAARQFVELRLLQRELDVTLHGTDKSGSTAVGTIHHPKGNIAVELLKNGLAKMSDWSVRMMNPLDVPALRIAETTAKRTRTGLWHSYSPPKLAGASELIGTVVEVLTGDTLYILPDGQAYDSESKLVKLSLASVRAPRLGNSRTGRADEPYCFECKDRLRALTVGKPCKVQVHYEREIPIGDKPETRQFGTVAVKNKPDIAEILISEGLATTQFHKDGEETSPRYDDLRAAEAIAKAAKKGLHSDVESKKSAINDLTDPKKAKAYSGSLMRSGKLKAVVDYCFNGSRFKLYVPSENCFIIFAPEYVRCPQPSPRAGSRQQKPGEPFGDASRRHARLTVLQRTVEITCSGVSMGGVVTGSMTVGQGGQAIDYGLELVGAGLATVDQRKIDYGEAPKQLIDAQAAAKQNRVGIWSIEQPKPAVQAKGNESVSEKVVSIRVSEIRGASHFFYQVVDDDAVKVVDDSMKTFTKNNGTGGAPCDPKVNKVVAALFDDGSGKSWYRAKIIEKLGADKVKVLFLDHGNAAAVPVATHLRPLDPSLGTDKIPPVAKEACLALTLARPISDEDGLDAARMFQSMCWGKDLAARIHGTDESGKIATSIAIDDGETVNEKLVSAGLARAAKPGVAKSMASRAVDGSPILKLAEDLSNAQEAARRNRAGMWRYGDIGDDDDEEI